MQFSFKHILQIFVFSVVFVMLAACSSENKSRTETIQKKRSRHQHKKFEVVIPQQKESFNLGEKVILKFITQDNLIPDSVQVFIDGAKKDFIYSDPLSIALTLKDLKVGKKVLRSTIFYSDTLTESHNSSIFVLTGKPPKLLEYKLLRTFWHDPSAFTQGLIFHDGFLYESTGQRGYSSLRKLDPKDGKVQKIFNLGDQFFGEGITLFDGQIYMITWHAQTGFVFNLETFELVRRFHLQTRQGWGLTNDGENLIQTDGSSNVYFYDPVHFTQNNQLDVCDNNGRIRLLNELEYNQHGLFSNVLGSDNILLINPETGGVIATLDLSRLFPEGEVRNGENVLNGIAYNSESDSYYITGKYWPVMYEIKIIL